MLADITKGNCDVLSDVLVAAIRPHATAFLANVGLWHKAASVCAVQGHVRSWG
jgi:hypothetical protein